MKAKIDTLLDILKAETDCYRTMERILTEEQAVIGFAGKAKFDRLQEQKEALVLQLQALEGKRQGVVDRLWAKNGNGQAQRTVTHLARQLGSPLDQPLLAAADRLRTVIGAVQQKNRRNQQLIAQYLKLIKGSLKLLTGLMDQNPVYARPGMHPSQTPSPVITGRLLRGTV